jgi:hypothetical protein
MKTIEIRRATETISRELVKQYNSNRYSLVIYKNTEPIFGGLYATALLTKHNTEVRTKNGLCLDAAIEVYNDTKKHLPK